MPENNTQNTAEPTVVAPIAPDAALSSSTPPASILEEGSDFKPSTIDKISTLLSNKGLIIGGVIVIIAVIVGISVIFSFNAVDQYQGMLKQIEQDTTILNSK